MSQSKAKRLSLEAVSRWLDSHAERVIMMDWEVNRGVRRTRRQVLTCMGAIFTASVLIYAIVITAQYRSMIQASASESNVSFSQRERRRVIATLARSAQQFMFDGKYREALAVVDQILLLDPANDYAKGMRQLVEWKAAVKPIPWLDWPNLSQ